MANGRLYYTKGLALNVMVKLQDYSFSSDIRLLSVTGCDLVLGAEWLETLGYFGWHFKNKIMEFQVHGRNYRLVGLHSPDPVPSPVSSRVDLSTLIASLMQASSHFANASPPTPQVEQFLTTYSDLFEPPKGLPPSWPTDHRITLLPGTQPVNVHSYRYAHAQKAEIERQVAEMLDAGIIHPSSSHFSSPAFLVHRTDGSWRFCVDYRALNLVIVKFPFPVPVIDELLDELRGATIFSKLDIRSGFHQIRMHDSDIPKTAFRTMKDTLNF